MTKLPGQQLGSKPHLPSFDLAKRELPEKQLRPAFFLFVHFASKRRNVETMCHINSNSIKDLRPQFTTGEDVA